MRLFWRKKSWAEVAEDEMNETPDERDAEERTYESRHEEVTATVGPGKARTWAELDLEEYEDDSETPRDPAP
jgi:hypothetical protein